MPEPEVFVNKDEFSIALERSFKDEEVVAQAEPKVFEIDSVKKDWENLQNLSFNKEEVIVQDEPSLEISVANDVKEEPIEEDLKQAEEETMGYPFANWGVK